jgi:hypothetical protein
MIKENPDAVKAAVARVFPDLNKDAVDLLSATELPAWTSAPVTVEDLKRDIEYAKASNSALTGWEQLDPPKLVWSPSTSR